MKSAIEEQLDFQIRAYRLPRPEREYKFHPVRRWKFDFAFPRHMVAVECEGGVWIQGRHNRGAGFIGDLEKYNEATRLGWDVYRFTGQDVSRGKAVKWLEEIFKEKNGQMKVGGTI
jgi:very-short-patch-repair endonuclease